MPFSDDVQKGLIAGAFGLVGTLVPAVLSWSHDRSATSARARTLEDAANRLAFWEQWLKLSSQVAEPNDSAVTERLKQDLTLLSEIIQKDSVAAHAAQAKLRGKSSEFHNRLDALPFWRRLLLLYTPARSTAWFPRIFFFAGLIFALLIPFGLAATPDPLTYRDFGISEAFILVWLFIFRSLSSWLEQPRHAPADPEVNICPPPPKPA
jgi:hypothetical protein